MQDQISIGLVGTGFIQKGLANHILQSEEFTVNKVLTRRDLSGNVIKGFDSEMLTNEVTDLLGRCDVAVVSTGDPIYNTEVINKLMEYDIPIITMDAETQVISGTSLSEKGIIVEAEGDQPGCLAALKLEVEAMGFAPLVYGNIKGFLNHHPTREDMDYWSRKQGISLSNVTSFTDGTKVQIEQALVGNGLGASVARQGLIGPSGANLQDTVQEIESLLDGNTDVPIVDYVVSKSGPAGVFILASHNPNQAEYLKYYKMGDGPNYILTKPYHLCHLEILKTIKNVLSGGSYNFNNGRDPSLSVASIAKRDMQIGECIVKGIGSFDVRGEVIKIAGNKNHLPIGLMYNVVLKRSVEKGQVITFDDVEIPESEALVAWEETIININEQ